MLQVFFRTNPFLGSNNGIQLKAKVWLWLDDFVYIFYLVTVNMLAEYF